ncbi:MAG: malto-oligosyltrehalose synthase [Chloroflexota bacterium]|nr:MAG: malto-oligosyltrehalose synthase [Chloroflexota bacterium]
MIKLENKDASFLANLVREVATRWRVPVSTYRLQFNRSFTFRDAAKAAAYLWELGISDCYASPYFKAHPDSTHGYDICDHNAFNPSLGDDRDYNRFVAELKKRGMGQILDVVPNHMGIGEGANAWWADVLENGPSSRYAQFFDVDWDPVKPELKTRVLLPILGDQYGRVLENQELILKYEEGSFILTYYDHRLPIAPRSVIPVLRLAVNGLSTTLQANDDPVLELRSIITALSHLPPRTETDPTILAERYRETRVIKRRLADLYETCPPARTALDNAVREFNGARGDPHSFDQLHALLEDQAYRLADWRVAAEEINYRRFFDINELAAIRMEDPTVFEATHHLILRLLREGKVNGLRVDHPDGLWDPAGYLCQLQRSYLQGVLQDILTQHPELAPFDGDALEEAMRDLCERERTEQPQSPLVRPLYIVVEKILQRDEELPSIWPVHGTTGYDFLNTVNGVFVDSSHKKVFDNLYQTFIGKKVDLRSLEASSKKMIMLVSLASEINALARHLNRISEKNRRYRDFTLNSLTFAIREVIAALPVYRTYVSADGAELDSHDRRCVETAIATAKKSNPRTSSSIFDFIREVLLLKWTDDIDEEDRALRREFVMKFQQTTGPVMAKGVEDTLFYVHNRLVSLNEVGGDPGRFGTSVESFHQQNAERQKRWPHSLLSTSTHDTKRSEDVRARVNVLSELPLEWKRALLRWSKLNRVKKAMVDGQPVPDPAEEYLLYQTLLGAWPLAMRDHADHQAFVERIEAYMFKALKEAKVNTSWVNPNLDYEEAVRRFLRNVLDDTRTNPFLEDFRELRRIVAHYGMFNALSQLLLKIASPGVPDFYQGTELWDFSLVDPDNRRPVNYDVRSRLLRALKRRVADSAGSLRKLAKELLAHKEDGRIKLYVTWRALSFRRDNPDLFAHGAYVPLWGAGSKAKHLCAFARENEARQTIIVVPRLVVGLTGGEEVAPTGPDVWEDTALLLPKDRAGQAYQNLFTGEVLETTVWEDQAALPLADIFSIFPVALLERLG